MIEDTRIYPLIVRLAACLCAEMQADGMPELCYCGVMTGPITVDFCGGDGCDGDGCGGQAWVRFLDAFQSVNFPAPLTSGNTCAAPLAFTVEVGVARCAPSGFASGASGYTPPTQQDHIDALAMQLADLRAMRRAVQCCFSQSDADYIMGTYTPVAVSQGGCLGGTFNLTISEEF